MFPSEKQNKKNGARKISDPATIPLHLPQLTSLHLEDSQPYRERGVARFRLISATTD
jgi:hypothetical protein